MRIYVFVIFFLGVLLSFGASLIANGYLTGRSAEQNFTGAGNLIALSAECSAHRSPR